MTNQPCPFCGSTKLEHDVDAKYQHQTACWIMCTECMTTGPAVFLTDKELDNAFELALIEWNKRAPVDIQGE